MILFCLIWFAFGLVHWVHWMTINPSITLLDFIIILPFSLAFGPIISIRFILDRMFKI